MKKKSSHLQKNKQIKNPKNKNRTRICSENQNKNNDPRFYFKYFKLLFKYTWWKSSLEERRMISPEFSLHPNISWTKTARLHLGPYILRPNISGPYLHQSIFQLTKNVRNVFLTAKADFFSQENLEHTCSRKKKFQFSVRCCSELSLIQYISIIWTPPLSFATDAWLAWTFSDTARRIPSSNALSPLINIQGPTLWRMSHRNCALCDKNRISALLVIEKTVHYW